MTQRYYRITDPSVLAAVQLYEADVEAINKAGKAFAAYFGGKALFSYNTHSYGFYGIRFSPAKPTNLWQVPDEQSVQRPRQRLKSPIDKSLKEPHKALLAEWDAKKAECFPVGRIVDRGPLHKAIGYNDGMAMLCGDSFLAFSHDGAVWVTSRHPIIDGAEEVTGSRFEAAREAAQEAVKA